MTRVAGRRYSHSGCTPRPVSVERVTGIDAIPSFATVWTWVGAGFGLLVFLAMLRTVVGNLRNSKAQAIPT